MKKLLLLICLALPVLGYAQHKKIASTYDLLIGTYTGGTGKGLYVYRLYVETGKVAYLNEFTTADNSAFTNPSYLCVAANNKFVYAVNENTPGSVSALAFNANTGKLKYLNSQSSGGSSPCYVSVDKAQKNIFVANYVSGTLAVLPVNTDGSLKPPSQIIQDSGTGANKARQEGPHVHTAILSPNEKYVLYTDLGTDKLNIERYHPSNDPPLSTASPAFVNVAPGNGPRHLAFSSDSKYLYLVQEMGAVITAYKYDNGKLTPLQSVNMEDERFKGQLGAADIHLSPDGKFLYATNRGDANDIVIYAVDANNGQLTYVGRSPSMGTTPRNFVIDPSGKFLLVANQGSSSVYIFRRDEITGKLGKVVTSIAIGNPVCLKIVPAE